MVLQALGLGFLFACLFFKKKRERRVELDGWEGWEDLEEEGGGGNRYQNILYKKNQSSILKQK